MPKETMTPKERWLAVLEGKLPDRLPMDYWGTPEITQTMLKYTQSADMWEMGKKLHIDLLASVGPKYVGPPIPKGYNLFGCKTQVVDYGTGQYEEVTSNPLAQYTTVEEIEDNYTWPSVDWYDFSDIPNQIIGKEDHAIRGGGSEPFLTYCQLRGLELAYMDLMVNPDIANYLLDKLFDLAYETTARIYEQIPGKVNISYVAEDLGSQESLLFSPRTIRKYFVPRMKRMMDLVHSAGAYVFFHSDGSVRKIIPDMIEAGIDIMNPIQWRCVGMEREGLKRDFGKDVVFHGGVDNQQTLPFGTAEDVKQEVLDNIRILGNGGGYVIAPCHNIQSITPPENVIAMYETGYENGWM